MFININKKRYLIFFVLLICILLLFNIFKQSDEKSLEENNELEKKTVQVNKIYNDNYSRKLIFRGYTEHSRSVTLKSQIDGKISSIYFKKGVHVKAGKKLLLIDPEDKVAKVKEMEALLDQRKKEFKIANDLFKKGFRSELNLSKARVNFETALAKFEKSQVELNNTEIIVPFDSFLDESFVELGDYLKKGDEIVKVVDLDPIYFTATVNEKDVGYIFIGQNGIVKLTNGAVSKGNINYISAISDKQTRKFKIQMEIKNDNLKILSGLTGEIQIKLKPQSSYFIPSSIVTLNEKGELGIKFIQNGTVKFKKVNILSDTGSGYWIKSFEDLEEIDIITLGQEYVLDGEEVNVVYQ